MIDSRDAEQFDIPVALFLFKRSDTVLRILDVLRSVRPATLFLIGDGPRNDDEAEMVYEARRRIEAAIDWPCEVTKNYAETNRGVFDNIAGGAKWVFLMSEKAIFLEDDNLPQATFFPFCREMLDRYEGDDSIFWVCGTNYLNEYSPSDGASYVFSKHLMPCGWASWSGKFNRYYDSDFSLLDDPSALRTAERTYTSRSLYRQQVRSARSEVYRMAKYGRYASWDFQLPLTIRANGLYGIVPCHNQIENIGVDEFSTHGGTSFANEMTRRFCSIVGSPLEFPLVHPESIAVDEEFERRTAKIILAPFKFRAREGVAKLVKAIFGVNEFEKFNKENMRWHRG